MYFFFLFLEANFKFSLDLNKKTNATIKHLQKRGAAMKAQFSVILDYLWPTAKRVFVGWLCDEQPPGAPATSLYLGRRLQPRYNQILRNNKYGEYVCHMLVRGSRRYSLAWEHGESRAKKKNWQIQDVVALFLLSFLGIIFELR